MRLVRLSCPSCGARLEVPENIDSFACSYCGTEYQVQRSGGTVSLRAVAESLNGIQSAIQTGSRQVAGPLRAIAAERAIPRLERELAQAEEEKKQEEKPLLIATMVACFLFSCGLLCGFGEHNWLGALGLILVSLVIIAAALFLGQGSGDRVAELKAELERLKREVRDY